MYVPGAVTVIAAVVAVVDQTFPEPAEDVSTTFPPAQKVVAPLAVMVGTDGTGFTVTVVEALAPDVHPSAITSTLNVPEADTVMDCVVAPFDQRFPVAEEEVSVTFPPLQKVVEPLAVIVGMAGSGFTVTLTGAEAADEQLPSVE